MAFSKSRVKAEAISSARQDETNFVPYDAVDYKGEFGLSFISCLIHNPETVHGFTCRPNPAYEEIKAGSKGVFLQTMEWFGKTLAS